MAAASAGVSWVILPTMHGMAKPGAWRTFRFQSIAVQIESV
jgi:hypothetical protein